MLLLVIAGCFLPPSLSAAGCSISAPASSTSRQISINVNCPGAKFFKLSSTSGAQAGVMVEVKSVDPAGQYADISVTYPGGTEGPPSQPFGIATQKSDPKVLAVVFDFASGDLGLPSYATPAWVNKLVFGGNFDGRGLPNGLKSYIAQNTYGTVNLSGTVYPEVIHIDSLTSLRDPATASGELMARKLADTLVQRGIVNPANNPYDFLIGFTAGGMLATGANFYDLMSQTWNYQGFEGQLVSDIPVDSTSAVYSDRSNEANVVRHDGKVITKFNPGAVQGVWLASDTTRTGQNYYASLAYAYQDDPTIQNSFLRYIKLNQLLPANTPVTVAYTPANMYRITDRLKAVSPPDTLIDDMKWYGAWLHESMHALDWLMIRSPANPNMPLLDMYNQPWELTRDYDVMSNGSYNTSSLYSSSLKDNISYSDPSHLTGHTKMQMGILTPYTLQYGKNQSVVRIYRTEESNFDTSASRIKLVKVPLNPSADSGFLQMVGSDNNVRKYSGDEYLLLEWRSKAPLDNQAHNFDKALPAQGLAIYRAIDSRSNSVPFLHGADNKNTVKIVDATPPLPPFASLADYSTKRQIAVQNSAALFGADSGVTQYTAETEWNWKESDTAIADFLLSPGTGPKTVYAKFMDLKGNIIGTASTQINLTTSTDSIKPSAILNAPINNATVSETTTLRASASDNVGVTRVEFFMNNTTLLGSISSAPYQIQWNTVGLANGSYTLLVKASDASGNVGVSAINNITISNQKDINPPTIPYSFRSPARTAKTIQLAWDASTDNVGVIGYKVYQNGVEIARTSLTSYTATGLAPSTAYSYKVAAYDAAGNTSQFSGTLSLLTSNCPIPTSPCN